MKTFIKYHNKFDDFLAIIASIALFSMMLLIFLDVAFRNLFNNPITGTLEITGEYLMVIVVYFAISYTQKHKEHVSVDLLGKYFNKRLEKVLSLLTNFLSLVSFAVLGYYNFLKGLEYFTQGTSSRGLLEYPLWPAMMIISIGIVSFCIRIIVESITIVMEKEVSDT